MGAWGAVGSENVAAAFFDEPYELRLAHSLDRQSNYATTLGRQASIAVLDGTSANPAGAAWTANASGSLAATLSHVEGSATTGNQTMASPVSLRWSPSASSSAYLAYAHTTTVDSSAANGLKDTLRSNEFFGGYSAKFGDSLSLGASVRYTDGLIGHDIYSASLGGQPLRLDTALHGPDLNVGASAVLSDAFTAGITATAGWHRTTTTVRSIVPLMLYGDAGQPIMIPSDTQIEHSSDHVRGLGMKAGIGWTSDVALAIYGDVSWAQFKSGRTGSVDLGKVAVGFEHALTDFISLRGGASINTERGVTLSVGAGYRLARDVTIHLAWQNNAAPEVEPEIGRVRLLAVSVALRF